jgi:hypothetical protein
MKNILGCVLVYVMEKKDLLIILNLDVGVLIYFYYYLMLIMEYYLKNLMRMDYVLFIHFLILHYFHFLHSFFILNFFLIMNFMILHLLHFDYCCLLQCYLYLRFGFASFIIIFLLYLFIM